jgi:GNAT superfamily N-acetyltransferase
MLDLRPEPSDSPASRALWEEYMALVASRLPGFRPTETIFATPDAFRGPGTAWLVGYADGAAVCCGGLRPLAEDGVGEIKRMFVSGAARRHGYGRTLLAALEGLAAECGYTSVRLFTTEVLVEARALYESAGYRVVGTVPDGTRTDFWLEKAIGPGRSPGTPANGAPAPGEDPNPVEETGGDREHEPRRDDA